MKKLKLLSCVFCVVFILSCKMGYEAEQSSSEGGKHRAVADRYKREAPDHIDIPLLTGGLKRVDVNKGYYIVQTAKNFDKTQFIKLGARIHSTLQTSEDRMFWHLYKNDEFFIKKVLRLDGVISAEYDFTITHIRPPKNSLEDLKPKPEGDGRDEGIVRPQGLIEGNMDLDPRMKEVNYSLQITHALDAYKELKDKQFKKPVLLGIIDTGFNYCHEDFWFTNTNGKQESISYFVKSPFLPGIASKDFDYTIGANLDENDPNFPYAKEHLQAYKHTNRLFEVPCSKVDPGNGSRNRVIMGPDSYFFWNWDDGEHGTHCTGMMAAVGNNNKGVVGVSWQNTKIASYKGFGGTSTGWEIYGALDDYANYIKHGIEGTLDSLYTHPFETLSKRDGSNTAFADYPYTSEQEKFEPYKDQKVYPVNMSLGGPFPSPFAAVVMTKCLQVGILPVVAMGNDGQRLAEFPTSLETSLSVGATDGRDRKKHFSCSGEWCDICAPGDGILSTGIRPGHNYPWGFSAIPESTESGGTGKPWQTRNISQAYTTMSGTSMATPFMTGTLGYLLSFENARGKNPGWLKAIVQSTADPLEGQTRGVHHEDYGYGRVNVLEAAKAVVANKAFAGTEWDYNTKNYVTVKLKNKRASAPDNEGNSFEDKTRTGLSGHPVVVYDEDSGDTKGFAFTNNYGEADFFFLSKMKRVGTSHGVVNYVARVNIAGDFCEAKFTIKDAHQDVVIEYDSPVVYISTINPHGSIFDKYSKDGEYDNDVDTIISIYEDGNFDSPIERFDYYTLDTLAFTAKPGKTYFAEITCFADPTTGDYRTGIYGLNIGYNSFANFRKGSNEFLNPMEVDKDKRQPNTGRLIYELIHGMDCWEPNDSFEDARKRGDFINIAKQLKLQSYVVCCLTHQSDGLDRDIFMFKTPEWDED